MRSLRIALAQINTAVGDLKGNAGRIAEAIVQAKASGADLVSVPELALSGYPPEDLLLRRSFLDDCRLALDNLLPATDGITAVIGLPVAENSAVFNAAAVVRDRKILAVYHKMELPNYGVFDEKRYFKRGARAVVVRLGEVRAMLTICEDIWVHGGPPERKACALRPDLVLNIAASPFHAGKFAERKQIVERFARRTGATVLYNSLVGGQDELVFDGGSFVLGPDGRLTHETGRFEEDLLLADLEFPNLTQASLLDGNGNGNGNKPSFIEVNAPLSGSKPPLARRESRELSPVEEVYSALVLGVRDYVRKNGFSKVLLGLSGGIDSALTAAIAADALGPENVTGVTMPSQYTSKNTFQDAGALAANLGIKLLTIPIIAIFNAYKEELEQGLAGEDQGIEYENLQARIRGNLLMALSNRFGWMVLTTGNKSETASGYSTLYGDTAGGFAVIKDVPKALVYQLAGFVNAKVGREVIARSILERPPTAELKPNQVDEDSLPPYPVLDPVVEAYVERDRSPDEIVAQGFLPDDVARIISLIDRNEYKRRQAPPGVKITPKAFGRDRRLPITNRYRPAIKGGLG